VRDEDDNLTCLLWYGRGKSNAVYRIIDYRRGRTETKSGDIGLFYLETEDILRELGLDYSNDNTRRDDIGAAINFISPENEVMYRIEVRTS
jgi:hypothetical protein